MTCAQTIYISNDNMSLSFSITPKRVTHNGACVEMTSWIWLLTESEEAVYECACVCMFVHVQCVLCVREYGFQGAIIKKVTISFYWLQSKKCI